MILWCLGLELLQDHLFRGVHVVLLLNSLLSYWESHIGTILRGWTSFSNTQRLHWRCFLFALSLLFNFWRLGYYLFLYFCLGLFGLWWLDWVFGNLPLGAGELRLLRNLLQIILSFYVVYAVVVGLLGCLGLAHYLGFTQVLVLSHPRNWFYQLHQFLLLLFLWFYWLFSILLFLRWRVLWLWLLGLLAYCLVINVFILFFQFLLRKIHRL